MVILYKIVLKPLISLENGIMILPPKKSAYLLDQRGRHLMLLRDQLQRMQFILSPSAILCLIVWLSKGPMAQALVSKAALIYMFKIVISFFQDKMVLM